MSKYDLPLAGLRVVEVTRDSVSAMACGRMLAAMGADVAMIEAPEGHRYRRRDALFGDVAAETFEIYARGKRSVVCDFSAEGDRDAFRRFLGEADLLLLDIDSYQTIEKLDLRHDLPNQSSLIVCCISPFGVSGPHADVPGSELTVQALAGVLATNGDINDQPVAAGVPLAAFAGSFYGLITILATIYERLQTGRGQFIDQSEFDAVISFQGTLIPGYLLTGEDFQRVGNRHTMTAPWNNYRTSDGWIVISTVGDQQWASLANAMGRSELADDERFRTNPDRVRNVDALDRLVENWTRSHTSADLLRNLEKSNVPASSVLTLPEALEDIQADYRMVNRNDGAAMPRLPFRLDRSAFLEWGEVPALGHAGPRWRAEHFPLGHGEARSGSGPLAGVRVVDIGILTSGPLGGRLLGMLGAEVLKIEPPQGERTRRLGNQVAGASYLYHLNNTDKLGLTSDVVSGKDDMLVRDLCKTADVFLTNIGEESLFDMQVAPADRGSINDRLIYCVISGSGRTGPKRGRKSFDMVIQALSGIMALTGARDGRPTKVALSIVDLMSALSGVAGTVTALIARTRYGYGQLVDTSLLDVGLWMTQAYWPMVFKRGEVPGALGNRAIYCAPHGCFQAADGLVAIAVQTDEQWEAWLRLAGMENLVADARYRTAYNRVMHVDDVERLVAAWLWDRTVAETVRSCARAGIPAAPVSSLAQAVEHPLTAARNMLVFKESSAGKIRLIGSPIKTSRSVVSVRTAAPGIGEHNTEIGKLLQMRA